MVIPSQCAQLFHSYFCSPLQERAPPVPLSLRGEQGWAVAVQDPGPRGWVLYKPPVELEQGREDAP